MFALERCSGRPYPIVCRGKCFIYQYVYAYTAVQRHFHLRLCWCRLTVKIWELLVELELLTLPEYMGFLSCCFLPGFELLNLNFVDHWLSFFLQPLHCLCFYKLRSLFIPLVSLNQQSLVSFPYLLHNLINVIKGSTSIYKSKINLNASP